MPALLIHPREWVGVVFGLVQALLAFYGLHRLGLLFLYYRARRGRRTCPAPPVALPPPGTDWPLVTVQLPVHNERYVVARLVDAACALDYPTGRLDIQVLDDSTDDTTAIAAARIARHQARGVDVTLLHRARREGFKAGAMRAGLASAKGELVAVFDADFVPGRDFLRRSVPVFADPGVGMAQARWGHLNEGYSALTGAQALFLDGHFAIEHVARATTGRFFNFNGTAGLWRRTCIEDAGGWEHDTLTEDLDLSYRAQLRGWRFLYLPDLVAPAELPVDIQAFKSQQRRWAKGSMQTARKLLPILWRAPLPARIKLEGAYHLSANAAYLCLLASLLLLGPVLGMPVTTPPWMSAAVLTTLFFTGTGAVSVFFLCAKRELGRGFRPSLARLPGALLLGAGLSLNNARGVLEAFLPGAGAWERTPKYALSRSGESWRDRVYRPRERHCGVGELALGLYALALVGYALRLHRLAAIPFLVFLAAGFLYVAWLSYRSADLRLEPAPRAPLPAPALSEPAA